MKLTVILEKQAKVYVDLPEDKAAETFSNIADMMIKDLEAVTIRKSHHEIIKGLDESAATEKHNPIEEYPEPKFSTENKKFVMTRCPECDNLIVGNMIEGQTIKCKGCGAAVMIKDLIPGEYKCPDCGWQSRFNVVGDLKTTSCKNCGSIIDLVYHEKKKMYLSANLLDKGAK